DDERAGHLDLGIVVVAAAVVASRVLERVEVDLQPDGRLPLLAPDLAALNELCRCAAPAEVERVVRLLCGHEQEQGGEQVHGLVRLARTGIHTPDTTSTPETAAGGPPE